MKPMGEIQSEQDVEDALDRMKKLANETAQDQSLWIAQEKENLEVFLFGTTEQEFSQSDGKLVVNEIQSAILATSPKEPARIRLVPVEMGDPGVQVPVATEVPVMDPATGADTGYVQPGVQMYQVNDIMVRKVYQKVFDVYWQRSRLDEIVRRGRIWTRAKGWQFFLYGFDDDQQMITLRTLSNAQCFPDRLQEFIKDFAHMGIDEYLDADYAMEMYPQVADKIAQSMEEGTPASGISNTPAPDKYNDVNQRRMVCLTTFWFRFNRKPMSEEEVLASGLLQPVELPTGEMVDAIGEDGEPLMNEDGSPLKDPEMRTGYADAEGNEITFGGPGWPTKPFIREIQSIEGEIVSDKECEHWDMPIIHDVHIPVFGRPWGVGDVFKLRKLQDSQSLMLDSIVKYTQTFAHPVRWMPQSVYNATKQVYHKAYIDPTMAMIVPDMLVQQYGGKFDFGQTAPQMNQALPQSYGILKNTMSEQSGYTQELRGVASNPDQSGKQTALLSQNAANLNEFMGRSEEDMLYRLARLILHSLVTRLEIQHISRICSQYPPEVLAQVINKARSMEWDLTVEVSNGTGMVNNMKRAMWLQDLQIGAISMQTYRELVGWDHEQELMRQSQEAMMMAPPGGAPPPGEEKNSDKP